MALFWCIFQILCVKENQKMLQMYCYRWLCAYIYICSVYDVKTWKPASLALWKDNSPLNSLHKEPELWRFCVYLFYLFCLTMVKKLCCPLFETLWHLRRHVAYLTSMLRSEIEQPWELGNHKSYSQGCLYHKFLVDSNASFSHILQGCNRTIAQWHMKYGTSCKIRLRFCFASSMFDVAVTIDLGGASGHRSITPKFVTPTALSCIDNSWRSTTLSPPKKLTSSTSNLE